MFFAKRNFVSSILAFAFLIGCTQPISEDSSQQLDNVTRFAASALGAPANVQRTALSQASEYQRLCRYLSGAETQLGPVESRVEISSLALAQEQTGELLLAYLEALEDASRGESITELTQARQGFVVSVGEFEAAARGSAEISPVVDALGNLIFRAGESQRQARIRGIMYETTDTLEILSALVERDVAEAIQDSEAAMVVWDRSAGCILSAMRTRPGAIDLYERLDAQRREFATQIVIIKRGPATLNSLVDAHLLAGEETATFEQVLQQVTSVAEETNTLVEAVEGL
ncbi:hypothetical protein ACMA5I_03025 [Paracoccaceae bacterium GXU_MW_L88]